MWPYCNALPVPMTSSSTVRFSCKMLLVAFKCVEADRNDYSKFYFDHLYPRYIAHLPFTNKINVI